MRITSWLSYVFFSSRRRPTTCAVVTGGQTCALPILNASGCGAMVKEYAHHLRHDPDYVAKALRLVDKVRDVAEIVAPHAAELKAKARKRVVKGRTLAVSVDRGGHRIIKKKNTR